MNPYNYQMCLYHSLTSFCNWNCSYCDFAYKEKKIVEESNLLMYIDWLSKINKSSLEFEIEGGESGLVPEAILDIWFNSNLSSSYQIDTNGLFIKRYYHKYKDKIHYMIYHCISEFESADQEFEKYDIPIEKIDYTVVLHQKNYKQFPALMEKHKDIFWLPHFLQPRRSDLEDYMQPEDYLWLYEKTKDMPHLCSHIKTKCKLLSDPDFFYKGMEKQRIFCARTYTQPLIDLVNMKIYRCAVSISGDYVDLTEINLKRLIQNDITLFPPQEKTCYLCQNSNATHALTDLKSCLKKIL